MYFNENKGDTNIDKEFKKDKTVELKKNKKIIFIIGGALLLLVILAIIVAMLLKRGHYSIKLYGLSEMSIYQGTEYNEPGYVAYDNKRNDVTSEVNVVNPVDTSITGEYTIQYIINNKKVKRIVRVVPQSEISTSIHLNGEKNVYLKVGDSYTEPGYTAIDINDGNLTDKVTVSGKVDTSRPNVYRIVYSVVNSNGITTSEIRTVIVE